MFFSQRYEDMRIQEERSKETDEGRLRVLGIEKKRRSRGGMNVEIK